VENIDHIGKNSLEALSRENLSEKNKKRLKREIISSIFALSFLLVGFIYSKFFPERTVVPAFLYTIGFLIEGIPVFIAAVRGIITKNLTNAMEILVSIAILACYFTQNLILAILIPVILNIVHFLEERSIMGGREALEGLKGMQQKTAVLYSEGVETFIDARSLKTGQQIIVKPGEGIPIDGVILMGETNIDQKSLTGEPLPFPVKIGDNVFAGTVNIDGRIIVEVKKEYVDTSFSKILSFLEKSENISVPESRLIDRFMLYYIPFVLAIATAVALVSKDITKAIAILVVSCPCGQMLVSSAPMIAVLSVATKHGILIKNSKFIEELTEIDTVVFDKTGTLTEGNLSLTDIIPTDGTTVEQLLSAAATVAVASMHPVSRAVCKAVENIEYQRDYTVKELSGKGMIGTSPDGLHKVCLGNKAWMIESGFTQLSEPDVSGTVSYVTLDGVLLGCLCFNDTVRPEAQRSINSLRETGITQTVMLTGDRLSSAEKIRIETGIDTIYAQLLPEDKLNHLHSLKKEHKVLVVGDGINDAMALRESDVGIAMGAMGSDTAIQSADIALMNNNLQNIPFIIELAKFTRSMIYLNLALSIGISAFMITLSAFGVIDALSGTILHNLGAFAVLLNSSRILKFKRGL